MFHFLGGEERRKEALLLEVDRKLAGMTEDLQNLAAAYALGMREGIRLGGKLRDGGGKALADGVKKVNIKPPKHKNLPKNDNL